MADKGKKVNRVKENSHKNKQKPQNNTNKNHIILENECWILLTFRNYWSIIIPCETERCNMLFVKTGRRYQNQTGEFPEMRNCDAVWIQII